MKVTRKSSKLRLSYIGHLESELLLGVPILGKASPCQIIRKIFITESDRVTAFLSPMIREEWQYYTTQI